MSDHDHRSWTLEPVISGFECTAKSHRHAGHLEIVGRDFGAVCLLRRSVDRQAEGFRHWAIRRQTLEHGITIAQVRVIRIRHRVDRPAVLGTADIDETFGRSDAWEGAEQQSVGDAEDGGVTGDADGDRNDRHQREGRAVEEGPEGVFHGTLLSS